MLELHAAGTVRGSGGRGGVRLSEVTAEVGRKSSMHLGKCSFCKEQG